MEAQQSLHLYFEDCSALFFEINRKIINLNFLPFLKLLKIRDYMVHNELLELLSKALSRYVLKAYVLLYFLKMERVLPVFTYFDSNSPLFSVGNRKAFIILSWAQSHKHFGSAFIRCRSHQHLSPLITTPSGTDIILGSFPFT